MIDGRTVGDIQPDSKSAQEVSALWLFIRGRLAKLYGGLDKAWAEKPRADFSTAVLTPETGINQPALTNASDEEEDWDVDLPAWANIAVANATVDRRQAAAPRALAQAQAPLRAAQGGVMEAPPPV